MHMKITIILIYSLIFVNRVVADEDELSTATLPLSEILRLYNENEKLKSITEDEPPVKAVISRIELKAQLLENAVDVEAQFQVIVVADNKWIEIPLLELGDNITIYTLPVIADLVLLNKNNKLFFLSQKQGLYNFTVCFMAKAISEGNKRLATIKLQQAALSFLCLRLDETIFKIIGYDELNRTADGFIIYPEKGEYHLLWEQKKVTLDKSNMLLDMQPEIESMVQRAFTSAVSTLEGNIIIRVLYELRFTGKKTVIITLPDMYILEKVYINGVLYPISMKEQQVELQVVPVRSGDQSGKVELVLSLKQGNYLLSGTVKYILPGVSWPVHEMFLTIHMPEVFDYAFQGGSLKSIDKVPAVAYTYVIPTPGKILSFHQYLIQSSLPSVTLDYTIDLDGNYFRAP